VEAALVLLSMVRSHSLVDVPAPHVIRGIPIQVLGALPEFEPFRNAACRFSLFSRYGQNTAQKAIPKTAYHNLDPGYAFRHHPIKRRMLPMLIGYARVSTTEQNLGLQTDALKRTGCERLVTNRASGGRAESDLAYVSGCRHKHINPYG
jgi:hypothetical protein